jgi:hypothetical protein
MNCCWKISESDLGKAMQWLRGGAVDDGTPSGSCTCSEVIIDKDDMTYIFLKELFVESDEQEDALEIAFKLEYEDRNQKK